MACSYAFTADIIITVSDMHQTNKTAEQQIKYSLRLFLRVHFVNSTFYRDNHYTSKVLTFHNYPLWRHHHYNFTHLLFLMESTSKNKMENVPTFTH